MANTNESGHAVNAYNFIERINVIKRHAIEYNPTNPAIKLTALTPISESVKNAIEKVASAKLAYSKATAKRQTGYNRMEDYVKRSVHLLNSSEATAEELKQGKTLFLKFKSERIKDLPDKKELKTKTSEEGAEVNVPKHVSVSQQGFVNRLNHFREIILFLKSVTAYKPNETDLTVEALESFAASIDLLNADKNTTTDDWKDAIDTRNAIMYKEPDGAYYLSLKFMEYVAGAKLKNSTFYKELQKFPIRNQK